MPVKLTNEVFQYKKKDKEKRKEKEEKKEQKKTKACLDSHSIPVPSSSNKNNIKKSHIKDADQNRSKKNERKTFQIKFSCFYLETTTKSPTCHNKLTNTKWPLRSRSWNFPMAFAPVSLLRDPQVRSKRTAGRLARVAKQQQPRAPHPSATLETMSSRHWKSPQASGTTLATGQSVDSQPVPPGQV